jgi:hypothetical protein
MKSPFAVFSRVIFEESGDVDIAFVGSSLVPTSIDAPYLSQLLEQRFGRKLTVRVLGFTFAGDDLRYAAIKDLLAHRRVKMLVIVPTLPWGFSLERPHPWAKYWFDVVYHRELLDGLPWALRAAYYGEAILGAPRRLVSSLRPELPPLVSGADLGSVLMSAAAGGAPFVELRRDPPRFAPGELIHWWSARKGDIRSLERQVPPLSHRLWTLTAELTRRSGTRLVALNLPYAPRDQTLFEVADWSALLGADTPLVGIAPARLFAGLDDAELASLYWEHDVVLSARPPGEPEGRTGHWNRNGSRYFTQAIFPALAELYDQAAR